MALLRVPTDYPTLDAALAAATPGDTVRIESAYANPVTGRVAVNDLRIEADVTFGASAVTLAAGVQGFTLAGGNNLNVYSENVTPASGETITIVGGATEAASPRGIIDVGTGGDRVRLDYSQATFPVKTDSGTSGGVNETVVIASSNAITLRVRGSEAVEVIGGIINDSLLASSGDDALYGGLGNDALFSSDGLDILDGGDGVDSLRADWRNSAGPIFVASGMDMMVGGRTLRSIEYFTSLMTTAANDVVTTSHNPIYNEAFSLGDGADMFIARTAATGSGMGEKLATLGGGVDTVVADFTGATERVQISTSSSTANITLGSKVVIRLQAWDPNQDRLVLTGGSANETLIGWAGNDVLNGGLGDDVIFNSGGVDSLDGGDGFDALYADWRTVTHDIVLRAGADNLLVDGTRVAGLEYFQTLVTGSGNDVVYADVAGVTVDLITTGAGNDTVTLYVDANPGQPGRRDQVNFGDGTDTLVVDFSQVSLEVIYLTRGTEFAAYSPSKSYFDTSQVERLFLTLTSRDEQLTGAPMGDRIAAGQGVDSLYGMGGDDELLGEAGADRLFGQDGADVLDGGAGDDVLTGGVGLDTARFSASWTQVSITIDWRGNLVVVGPDGRDVLTGIERLQFSDRTIEQDANDGVDDIFYLVSNPDVWLSGLDADDHFAGMGRQEGRAPNAYFDPAYYRATYADIAASGVDPFTHYMEGGWREGRATSAAFSTQAYVKTYPGLAAENPLIHYLVFGRDAGLKRFGLGFDEEGYVAAFPDIAAAGIDPVAHYAISGWREGRDPSASGFDTTRYLAAYPDVAAAGVNPYLHWLLAGQAEGRSGFGDGTWN